MNPQENTMVTDPEDVLTSKYVDLKQLAIRAIIEPQLDRVLHVYSAPRDRIVDVGDILYRNNGPDNVRMYRVLYATTLRYPVSACARACSSLPYELFVKLEPITDEQELAGRYCELRADQLTY